MSEKIKHLEERIRVLEKERENISRRIDRAYIGLYTAMSILQMNVKYFLAEGVPQDFNLRASAVAKIDLALLEISHLVSNQARSDAKIAAASKEPEYRCVKGHDRCDQMTAGPECLYCERKL